MSTQSIIISQNCKQNERVSRDDRLATWRTIQLAAGIRRWISNFISYRLHSLHRQICNILQYQTSFNTLPALSDSYHCINGVELNVFFLQSTETWAPLAADIKALVAFHTKCQRQILRICWFDFVSNVDILARLQFSVTANLYVPYKLLYYYYYYYYYYWHDPSSSSHLGLRTTFLPTWRSAGTLSCLIT